MDDEPERNLQRQWARACRQWADHWRMVADLQSHLGPDALSPSTVMHWSAQWQWEIQNFAARHIHPDLVVRSFRELDALADYLELQPPSMSQSDDRLSLIEAELRHAARERQIMAKAVLSNYRTARVIAQLLHDETATQEEDLSADLAAIVAGRSLSGETEDYFGPA